MPNKPPENFDKWRRQLTRQISSTRPNRVGGRKVPLRHTIQYVDVKPVPAPSPMADKNTPVDWLFAFKFNSETFLDSSDFENLPNDGIFGGTKQEYKSGHSQAYVSASSASPSLTKGTGCLGATENDPLGATFKQIYNKNYFYVVWNDQLYGNPIANEDSPWGHSKGILAWNADGKGMVLQVSTPSWPGSGSSATPRKNDGNTLGYIKDDNILVSQHFFALKLAKNDVIDMLKALSNASVVTNLSEKSIVNNGGPEDIQALVKSLGKKSVSRELVEATLSSGVKIISKPSFMHVPPWQMVSARLGGLGLRVASWWAAPKIYSTINGQTPDCWDSGVVGTPGAVEIATTGTWDGKIIGLKGGPGRNFNHAKIGISKDSQHPLCIFGDMNQQGTMSGNCSSSQNGRGGTFYVLENQQLFTSLTSLLSGDSAPTTEPT
ncbi:MAG: deoxyribonuclease II family protein [Bacteroidota bacterium]